MGNIEDHIMRVHEKKDKSFQCLRCELRFDTIQTMKNHIKIFHEKKKPFQCSKCELIFARKDYLKRHALKCCQNTKANVSDIEFEVNENNFDENDESNVIEEVFE